LASVCDFALAEETARFGYPEVKRGLVAALVLTFAARQLSDRRLRELFLLGELIEAKKAEEYGLISEVVPNGGLEKRAQELAHAALESAPGAVSHLKRLIEEFQQKNLTNDLHHALAVHKVMRTHRESQEGISAFFEGRKPRWYP
ncbi:MAG: enoyl-CoA hydratase/isomerase family protein, partial [Chlamydiia bacterium]|nr:enoyl-CoA hydratase/isomerase family protein [Chlamydiia bacterium]